MEMPGVGGKGQVNGDPHLVTIVANISVSFFLQSFL